MKLKKDDRNTKLGYSEKKEAQKWLREAFQDENIIFLRAVPKEQFVYGENRMDQNGLSINSFQSIYSFGDTDCLLIKQVEEKEEKEEEFSEQSVLFVSNETMGVLEKIKKINFGKLEFNNRKDQGLSAYFSQDNEQRGVSEVFEKGSVLKADELREVGFLKKL